MTSLSKIDAVILCGGLGQRLKSTIGEKQKVMAEINQRPFLDLLMDYLKKNGLRRFILCTGYQADMIEQYYRKNKGTTIFEFSREKEPLGTGGALKHAQGFVKSDPFFVLNGDSFCAVDLKALFDFHQFQKALASLVIAQAQNSKDFGSITLGDSQRIVAFDEKQGTGTYVNAGVYCFNRSVFNLMSSDKNFSLEYDFFPKLAGRPFYGFLTDKELFDIGTPERYEKAKRLLRRKRFENEFK